MPFVTCLLFRLAVILTLVRGGQFPFGEPLSRAPPVRLHEFFVLKCSVLTKVCGKSSESWAF